MFEYRVRMGWNNPDVPWAELEAALSGRPRDGSSLTGGPPDGDGGDSPAWSRKREPYEPPEVAPPAPHERVPFAELHCHSNFSFLDGASHPEELVEQAARLGLDALALTDHDGMYGVVRFAEAARQLGVATVFGAELSLGLSAPQNGVADPEGSHLLLLARDPAGYRALCRTISSAQLRGQEKGRPVYVLDEVVAETAGHVVAMVGRPAVRAISASRSFCSVSVGSAWWLSSTATCSAPNRATSSLSATAAVSGPSARSACRTAPLRQPLSTTTWPAVSATTSSST